MTEKLPNVNTRISDRNNWFNSLFNLLSTFTSSLAALERITKTYWNHNLCVCTFFNGAVLGCCSVFVCFQQSDDKRCFLIFLCFVFFACYVFALSARYLVSGCLHDDNSDLLSLQHSQYFLEIESQGEFFWVFTSQNRFYTFVYFEPIWFHMWTVPENVRMVNTVVVLQVACNLFRVLNPSSRITSMLFSPFCFNIDCWISSMIPDDPWCKDEMNRGVWHKMVQACCTANKAASQCCQIFQRCTVRRADWLSGCQQSIFWMRRIKRLHRAASPAGLWTGGLQVARHILSLSYASWPQTHCFIASSWKARSVCVCVCVCVCERESVWGAVKLSEEGGY